MISLPIGGLALTADNAGGHFRETKPVSMTIESDNARSRFSGGKPGPMPGSQKAPRRHTGGGGASERWARPSLIDGDMNNSFSSIKSNKSTSSKSITNAARRLSMFGLKHVDRSKLRHVGTTSPKPTNEPNSQGSQQPLGSLKGADLPKRPELVRRNTCGTLYVGATMSAPDKDATIKVSTVRSFIALLNLCCSHTNGSVSFETVRMRRISCPYSPV